MRLLAAVGLWAAALVVAGPPAFGDVDVHARLDRRSLTLGETASLEVVVSGFERGAGQPLLEQRHSGYQRRDLVPGPWDDGQPAGEWDDHRNRNR